MFSCPKCGKTIIQASGKTLVGCEHYPTEPYNKKKKPDDIDIKDFFNKLFK